VLRVELDRPRLEDVRHLRDVPVPPKVGDAVAGDLADEVAAGGGREGEAGVAETGREDVDRTRGRVEVEHAARAGLAEDQSVRRDEDPVDAAQVRQDLARGAANAHERGLLAAVDVLARVQPSVRGERDAEQVVLRRREDRGASGREPEAA
jgi:hypothetical protein